MIVVFAGLVLLHFTHTSCQKMSIEDFCNVKCSIPKAVHTVCKFKCKVDETRCNDFKFYPLSNEERQILLDQHNMYRNNVASGEDRRGGNEPAKNMKVLNYDVDMEVTTYCWGKRCYFGHDRCRHIPKYTSAGQNLFLRISLNTRFDGKDNELLNTSVRFWYEEIKHSTKALIESFELTKEVTEHFTQVVWGSTQFMACSRVTWTDNSDAHGYKYYLICNYSPSGNLFHSPVYEFGEGCNPPDEPNERYKALCGRTLPIVDKDILLEDEIETATQTSAIPFSVNTSPIRFNGVMTLSLIYLITRILI